MKSRAPVRKTAATWAYSAERARESNLHNQLGRSVMVHPERRAKTYVLVTNA